MDEQTTDGERRIVLVCMADVEPAYRLDVLREMLQGWREWSEVDEMKAFRLMRLEMAHAKRAGRVSYRERD